MWRIMFWVGDAGCARDNQYMSPLLSAASDNGIVAVEGSGAESPAANSTLKLPNILNITSQTLNLSQDPFVFKVAKGFFTTMAAPLRRSDALGMQANVTINPLVAKMLEQGHSSILSDVHFLKTLSPSPFVNRFIMDVLEGQIITLSVVIVCILVFLIREWVVQQQPVVDLGGADADNALARAGGGALNQENDQDDELEVAVQLDGADAEELDVQPVEAGQSAANSTSREQYEQSLRDLRDSLDKLEMSRTMMNALEEHLEGGIESLPSPQREQILELKDKTGMLEQRILDNLREQRMGMSELAGAFEPSEASMELLKEMFEKLEGADENADSNESLAGSSRGHSPSQTRPTMPARGQSSLATGVIRDLEEHSGDDSTDFYHEAPQEQDEDGHDSNGSWQQVSDSEKGTNARQARQDSSRPMPNVGDATTDVRDDLSWVSTAGSVDERTANEDQQPKNSFAPNEDEAAVTMSNEDNAAAQGQDEEPQPQGLVGRIVAWLWGDIAPPGQIDANDDDQFEGADDEQVVADLAAEAPFVPFEDAQPIHGARQPAAPEDVDMDDAPNAAVEPMVMNLPEGDGQLQGGDLANAMDAEAIEDAEDLEGILELIGMQGPLAGLIQNAIFSSILISLSVAVCVFLPYVWGKLVLLHIAEPSLLYKVPLKTATVVADLAIDAGLAIVGHFFYGISELYRTCMMLMSVNVSDRTSYKYVLDMHKHAQGALRRLGRGFASTHEIEAGDFLYLSMACHTALYVVEEWVASELTFLLDSVKAVLASLLSGDIVLLSKQLVGLSLTTAEIVLSTSQTIWHFVKAFYTNQSISVSTGTPLVVPNDPMLTYWNARDRALAVLAGYVAVSFICAMYVKIAPLTSSTRGRRVESYIVEACLQAGGVLKVVLIISIEMIAFPLFCGFLLDFALMPLFENASFASRLAFTLGSPWTSGFVHWFVGTCYMFHFALFVSMCRRILRTGVLYFIRDPDDPTFHPVRDVLERNVITQLRKIAFSAIVYGALIIVCLGGIVWGLWLSSNHILPIHWSSTGSNIEFPLDILFYNFLTPFVVHYAKPSAGITAMYSWWFKKVARGLRLSEFLFREKRFDEEGHWVRHTWNAWLTRRINNDLSAEDVDRRAIADGTAKEDALDDGIVRFVPDGRYVRAPASDQVRIPKGGPVFVPVDPDNVRLDGKPDDEGVHASSSSMVAKVYIPPWFKVRIGIFVTAVWLFAAATGLSVTIVPLLFGRYLLSSTFGPKDFVNDIYAFSLGIYLLGGALYAGIHRKAILTWAHKTFIPADGGRQMLSTALSGLKRLASLLYVYSTLAIGLPLVNAVLLEVYILMPMHFMFDSSEHHVMHLVQDWTLGILYVRIGMRMFLFDAESRPARAIRQVFAKGYFNPDARRATRFFILPIVVGFALLMGVPFIAAVIANKTYFRNAENEEKIAVMRLAYPIASASVIAALVIRKTAQAAGRWRARIRDEVYLVGERLHNFGERKHGGKGKEKENVKASDIVVL
jgi:E3 ubiquitin-protein ligase MARCH6